METIVIAIDRFNNSDQLNIFGSTQVVLIDGDFYRVLVHNDPKYDTNGICINYNFDIYINTKLGTGDITNPLDNVNRKNVYYLTRECKSTMRNRINAITGENLKPIKFYTTSNDNKWKSYSYGSTFCGDMVIKSEWGARGVGQVKFNTKDCSPGNIVHDIGALSLDAFKEKYPTVKITGETESDIKETKDHLKNNKLYLEEFVHGVVSEFRVLFSPKSMIIVERDIRGDVYPQAIGSDSGMLAKDSTYIPPNIRDAAKLYISALGLEYGSMDLFLTKDDEIGCFEYSTQYGAEGINPSDSFEINREFIETLIRRFLKDKPLNNRD